LSVEGPISSLGRKDDVVLAARLGLAPSAQSR
jgi:hypothetical protein